MEEFSGWDDVSAYALNLEIRSSEVSLEKPSITDTSMWIVFYLWIATCTPYSVPLLLWAMLGLQFAYDELYTRLLKPILEESKKANRKADISLWVLFFIWAAIYTCYSIPWWVWALLILGWMIELVAFFKGDELKRLKSIVPKEIDVPNEK